MVLTVTSIGSGASMMLYCFFQANNNSMNEFAQLLPAKIKKQLNTESNVQDVGCESLRHLADDFHSAFLRHLWAKIVQVRYGEKILARA